MARQILPTDVAGTGALVRDMTNAMFEEIYPITEPVTKTVGAGKDFETFHEAMTWACSTHTTGNGAITLTLDDGLHTPTSKADFNSWWYAYYPINNSMTINSASGNKANCIISLPVDDNGEDWPSLFLIHNGWLNIVNLTVDVTATGATQSANVTVIHPHQGGTLSTWQVDIKGGYPIYATHTGAIALRRADLYADATRAALSLLDRTTAYAHTVTFATGAFGIKVYLSAVFSVDDDAIGSVTFAPALGANTNIPLNEIQYTGAYISDGTAALSFKA
jgi:hypothetical protein